MTAKLPNENDIFFVDDDEMEVMLVERYLTHSRVKNNLLAFGSGEELIEHLVANADDPSKQPALLLLDMRMPSLDGFEVAKAVRGLPSYSKTPLIVMFSNSDNPSDIARSKEFGADEYVIKPSDGPAYIEFLNSLVAEV
ncbi:response regulator [Pseudobythopirellula maris]|nr:response regulator [Pseudobythopirellula maris]